MPSSSETLAPLISPPETSLKMATQGVGHGIRRLSRLQWQCCVDVDEQHNGDTVKKLDSKHSFKRSSSIDQKDESQIVGLKQRYELIDLPPDARPLLVFINKKRGPKEEVHSSNIEHALESCLG
ncbi:Diacylglycerol kinase 1 [Camellia lanceoleosa]|uniref:Diacylglycerol kinase 1 n=1 Tax=Camellia lanceoleosa TaxID=1840588 RepID=A0ACC0GW22_9ERIC|nr:Diacylglycerol kinase 1 [Camellia lanceoleosa]